MACFYVMCCDTSVQIKDFKLGSPDRISIASPKNVSLKVGHKEIQISDYAVLFKLLSRWYVIVKFMVNHLPVNCLPGWPDFEISRFAHFESEITKVEVSLAAVQKVVYGLFFSHK